MPKEKKMNNDKRAEPWISMRSGVRIIALTSLGMAVLTAFQAIPAMGWLEGLLWSVFFGALIWIIFFGMIFVNRFFFKP